MIGKIIKRDLFNSKSFVLIFIFNLFLGVIGFVVLHSFRGNVNELLESRSRQLMASDMYVAGRRDLKDEEREKFLEYIAPKTKKILRGIEVYSMARPAKNKKRSRLVDIISVQKGYPLYGEIKFKDKNDQEFSSLDILQNDYSIIVSPEILHQMKVKIEDELKIGEKYFKIIGVITGDSTTSWRGLALAPKLYMARKHLFETELLGFGSVASYAHQMMLKDEFNNDQSIKELKVDLDKLITDKAIKVRTPKGSSQRVGRVLNYLSDYLGLVGLVALFLSGIGAGYLFQNYLFSKIKDIGILKSLGMRMRDIFQVYLFQLVILSLLSAIIANFTAYLILPIVSKSLYDYINLSGSLSLNLETLLISFAITIGSCLLVCIPILLKMLSKNIKHLFGGSSFFQFDFTFKDYFAYVPLLAFLWGLSIYQAHSFKIGTLFTISLLIVGVFISVSFPLVFKLIDKHFINGARLVSPFTLKLGMATRSLLRDKLSTILTLISITTGVMLLALIGQLETSLRGELTDDQSEKPSLFMFDIQEEQAFELEKFAKEQQIPIRKPQAMVRARLLKVNDKEYKKTQKEEGFQTREEERSQRFRNRGVNLTFAKSLNSSETLVKGEWFKDDDIDEISVEKRYADRMGIDIGDTMTFDVLGVEVKAVITSIRSIKWTSFLPNFFITFEDGIINNAPKSYISVVNKVSFERQLEIQDLIVDRFANISIINVTEVINKILGIFKAMSLAIRIMALLCLTVGFFVLFAIIQNQLAKKRYEAALQKVFGMTSSNLFLTIAYEYLIIVIIACTIGIGFSLVLGIVVSNMFFDGVWRIDWFYNLGTSLMMILFTFILSFIASRTYYSTNVKSLLK